MSGKITAPLSAVATVLNIARGHTWVVEVGENRGQAVEAILARVGLPPGQPWCAAFVAYIGWLALRELWPLPKDGGCQKLSEDAAALGMLELAPATGRIFLLYGQTPTGIRFHHCGFITGPGKTAGTWATVEGNTNAGGSPDGTGVFLRERSFDGTARFIEWATTP